jgi:hypothetical protein
MAERFPLPVAWHCGLITYYLAADRADEARRELDRLSAGGFAQIPDDHNWLSSMVMLGNAAAELDDRPKSGLVYDALAPYATRVVTVGISGPCIGVVEQTLGTLARCLDRCDDALAHFERAVASQERLGLAVSAALGRLGQAETLLQRARPGDRKRARTLIDTADAYARPRDLGLLQQRADRLRARLESDDRKASARDHMN